MGQEGGWSHCETPGRNRLVRHVPGEASCRSQTAAGRQGGRKGRRAERSLGQPPRPSGREQVDWTRAAAGM